MEGVDNGSLVVLHCANPREKMWGLILRLDELGVVLRGLELASVEDWFWQLKSDDEVFLGALYRLTAQPMKLSDTMVLVNDEITGSEIIE